MAKAKPENYGTLNEAGHEVLDPTPMKPRVGHRPQPSVNDRIRAMVRSERLRQAAEEAGMESFEEADDFDIPDDPIDPSTPYEEVFEGDVIKDVKDQVVAKAKELEAERQPVIDTGDKQYSGDTVGKLIEFIREAPRDIVDKLFKSVEKK